MNKHKGSAKILIIIILLVLIAAAGFYLYRKNSVKVLDDQVNQDEKQTQQITLYHMTDVASEKYESTVKTIEKVPQIADVTLKELFVTYLPALDSNYIGVSIKNGVATVNFKTGAQKYFNHAEAGVSAINTGSIRKTLLQFKTITSVQYAINGVVITEWDA